MHRATLLRIMTSLRDAGGIMLRDKLGQKWNHSRLNAILNQPYPQGLKYLATEEKVKGPRQPIHRWVLTRLGREFLIALEANPQAVPVIPPYTHVHTVESLLARDFQEKQKAERLRKARWAEKLRKRQWQRRRDPAIYDEPLQGRPRDRNFKNLSAIDRIRILRTRSGRIRKGE